MLKAEDISAENIKSGMGGYKKKETEEYIDTVRREYELLVKENIELKDKLSVLSEGVQYYKNMEKSLQKALVLAEKTTSETMQAAEVKAVAMEKEAQVRADSLTKEAKMRADSYEKEATIKAENLIRDAKQKADQEIASANDELRKIHSQIMTLIQQYEQYKSQYKQLAMAQMQVLESEAYNLDAPILQSISSFLKNNEVSNDSTPATNNSTPDNTQEVMESIKTSVQSENSNPEKEKKIYVDARGEVIEVHEFREISGSGEDFTNDPWDTEPEEDLADDFDNPTQKYEGPYSFTQDNTSENELNITPSQDYGMDVAKEVETPIQSNSTSGAVPISQSEKISTENSFILHGQNEIINSNMPNVNYYDEVEPRSEFEPQFESEPKTGFEPQFESEPKTGFEPQFESEPKTGFEPQFESEPKTGFEPQFESEPKTGFEPQFESEPKTGFEPQFESEPSVNPNETVKENTHPKGNISFEEMKRIEKMQLERLREQEEKQLEKLKSEHYHNYSNVPVPSKEQEQKKEQDPADIFRALHKNDDSEPTVTLQDLKQQQELENSPVSLPKASEQSSSEGLEERTEQTKKATTPPPMDDFLSFEPLDMTKDENKASKKTITYNNKIEKTNSTNDKFFHQFSEQAENSFHAKPSVEEGNSLDFEMDNNQSSYGSEHGNTSKFKSFREFESEL